MTAADKYYLKAKDNYPYDINEALEALEYGLSHDDAHPGLLTLQGNIYYEDLKQFDAARECYELALFSDAGYVDTYYAYIKFALDMSDYKKADKLITAALKVKGINQSRILYSKGALFEKQNQYHEAVCNLRTAKQYSRSKEEYAFIENEIERIELKDKKIKEYKAPINIILTS